MKSNEELVQEFREAFENLPDEYKVKEVDRIHCLVHGKRFIVLEDHETGKLIKFLDMKNVVEYLYKYKKVNADRCYLYKVLKGKYNLAYGYHLYYEEIT